MQLRQFTNDRLPNNTKKRTIKSQRLNTQCNISSMQYKPFPALVIHIDEGHN